jgi:hypothetical protein
MLFSKMFKRMLVKIAGKKKPPREAVFSGFAGTRFTATCTDRYSTALGLEWLK